jgi:DNA repair protein RadA/Sms
VRRRAERLDALVPDIWIIAETGMAAIEAAVRDIQPDILVIDSIQTIWDPDMDSAPGSMVQVRGCAHQLAGMAKANGPATILVGHVTKEGALAGPRVLEHLVDTVLSFEGDRLVEIQALVVSSQMVSPRRSATGFDGGRLALLLAVLDQRAGLSLGGYDVYVSAVGGVRVVDPGADLAVCLALASAITGVPVGDDVVALGEIGLAGEVRQVSQTPRRLAEAARLGFTRAVLPDRGPEEGPITLCRVPTLSDALGLQLGLERPERISPGGLTSRSMPEARRSKPLIATLE